MRLSIYTPHPRRINFLTIAPLLLTLLAVLAFSTQAQDTPDPDPLPPRQVFPGVFTNPDWLSVDYHRITVEIEDQIAQTTVDMQFTNNGNGLAEGTFAFPIPANATVDRLTMFINGEGFEGKILSATEARNIYDEIVRQYRDPALLEYIGTQAIQANVFPIPPGESRRIVIAYSQVLEIDNGLFNYVYAMDGDRSAKQTSISVDVVSDDPISTIYSPSHNIAINRASDTSNAFRVGYEGRQYESMEDFNLYYTLATDTININLLTYRESANEDGFFMMLVQPPIQVNEDAITAKDIILVVDQSGSMDGVKWDQAREAAAYVLENLNPQDRFNVVVFSTGFRLFSDKLESADVAPEAVDWVRGLYAEGGTDINAALLAALDMVEERPATILFLTDGEPTEGVIELQDILTNLDDAAKPNARIFSFGVGDDVNTFLLDEIVGSFRGTGTYVRPDQRIDESVAALYNKVNAPVLTDVSLDFGGVNAELLYPQEISDLFAGEQLTIVGRYRDGAENVAITLSGEVRGESQTFVYDNLSFRERAGGESFIARLWATRRIADLLNTIRLRGENRELVDSIVSLSVRYGIITPYTSFLIEEDDILTQQGRNRAMNDAEERLDTLGETASGAGAVDAAVDLDNMQRAAAPLAAMPTMSPAGTQNALGGTLANEPSTTTEESGQPADDGYFYAETNPIKTVGDKTFILLNGVWTDTTFEPDTMETTKVVFLSDEYFDLLDEIPELAEYLAIGDQVIIVYDDVAYEITAE